MNITQFTPKGLLAHRAIALFFVMLATAGGLAIAPGLKAETNPGPAKVWRLPKEMVAADSRESYLQGEDMLTHSGALEAAAVSKLFFWGKLTLLPAGTVVASEAPDRTGAKRVRLVEGTNKGKIYWLLPQTAQQLGFDPRPAPK